MPECKNRETLGKTGKVRKAMHKLVSMARQARDTKVSPQEAPVIGPDTPP